MMEQAIYSEDWEAEKRPNSDEGGTICHYPSFLKPPFSCLTTYTGLVPLCGPSEASTSVRTADPTGIRELVSSTFPASRRRGGASERRVMGRGLKGPVRRRCPSPASRGRPR